MKRPKYEYPKTILSHSTKQETYIDQLEAENKELKMCLQYLVDTKKHKELNGKDVTYIQMRKIAWDNANKILKKG